MRVGTEDNEERYQKELIEEVVNVYGVGKGYAIGADLMYLGAREDKAKAQKELELLLRNQGFELLGEDGYFFRKAQPSSSPVDSLDDTLITLNRERAENIISEAGIYVQRLKRHVTELRRLFEAGDPNPNGMIETVDSLVSEIDKFEHEQVDYLTPEATRLLVYTTSYGEKLNIINPLSTLRGYAELEYTRYQEEIGESLERVEDVIEQLSRIKLEHLIIKERFDGNRYIDLDSSSSPVGFLPVDEQLASRIRKHTKNFPGDLNRLNYFVDADKDVENALRVVLFDPDDPNIYYKVAIGPISDLFSNEEKILSQINSDGRFENIPKFLDAGDEWIKLSGIAHGQNLTSDLWKQEYSVSDKVRVLLGVIKVVGKLHQLGIVHGDIKLENVIVNKNSEFMVIDFGNIRQSSDFDEWKSHQLDMHAEHAMVRHLSESVKITLNGSEPEARLVNIASNYRVRRSKMSKDTVMSLSNRLQRMAAKSGNTEAAYSKNLFSSKYDRGRNRSNYR